jgi:hypothetical protein
MLHSAVPQACSPRDLARLDPAVRASLLRSARSSTRPRQGVCRRRATVARGAALAVKRERGRADPAQLNSSQRWRIPVANEIQIEFAAATRRQFLFGPFAPSRLLAFHRSETRACSSSTAPDSTSARWCLFKRTCCAAALSKLLNTGHRCPIRRVDRLEQDVNRPRQRKSNSGMF